MLKFLGSLHSAGFAFTVNREAQPITRTESEAGCKYWHLVKQDDLNTGIKISSEVFLTRLLATKVCQSLTCTVCVSEIKMWNLKEETFLDNIFLNLKSLFIIYAEVIICSHLYTSPKVLFFCLWQRWLLGACFLSLINWENATTSLTTLSQIWLFFSGNTEEVCWWLFHNNFNCKWEHTSSHQVLVWFSWWGSNKIRGRTRSRVQLEVQ